VNSPAPNLGLRERNKQRAMRQIQEAALDLFDQRGFQEVTVEQIAEAAGVSPSTVYRYFGTKDRIVLHDEDDRFMAETLIQRFAEGATLLDAARAVLEAMRPALGPDNQSMRRRFRLMFDEPSVAAAAALESRASVEHVSAELNRLRGREPGDLAITLAVTNLVGALLLAVETWRRDEFASDIREILLRAFALLDQRPTV
jgi:AcrR family transcriptional regulator